MDNLLLITEPFLTGKPVKVWLDSMGIKDWSINAEGLVDVEGGVNLEGKLGDLKRLPVRFGQVDGYFWCDSNQLVSLEGSPKKVGVDFHCYGNQLVSLEGAPKQVGGSFWCNNNQLVSLEGAPQKVGGAFACHDNQLVSLEGAPKQVGGDFYCNGNQLVSLEGAPNKVGRDFHCSHNLLVDFKGMEGMSIGGNLYVTASQEAGQDNVFVSLEGLPKELYEKMRCLDTNNGVVGFDVRALLAVESQHSGIPDIEI